MSNTATMSSFTYWADSRNRRAAVALLLWLGKSIPTTAAWTSEYPDQRAIDVDRLWSVSGPWSGGERRVVAVALSLLDFEPCNLSDVLGGLGGEHRRAVLHAITYTGGLRLAGGGPLSEWLGEER